MKPDSLEYQKSIVREFEATKNRVRHLIGSTHFGEEGRYKEIILMNFLKRLLPNTVSVGTGFIKEDERLSTQIDIILYDSNAVNYFKENEFVIVHPSSVIGIIEVKSNPNRTQIAEAIIKSTEVGKLIDVYNKPIFNGVFIYGDIDKSNNIEKLLSKPKENSQIRQALKSSLGSENGVNHIVMNDGAFVKKWPDSNEFEAYAIKELATSYFFSNLLSYIGRSSDSSFVYESMYKHLFPLVEGKKTHQKWRIQNN